MLDPGELLEEFSVEWAESDACDQLLMMFKGRQETFWVGELGWLSTEDRDLRCGDIGDPSCSTLRLLSLRKRDDRRRLSSTGLWLLPPWRASLSIRQSDFRLPIRIDVLLSGTVRIVILFPPVRMRRTSSMCSRPCTDVSLTCVMRSPALSPASIAGLLVSTACKYKRHLRRFKMW